MVLLGLAVSRGWVPTKLIGDLMHGLHGTIGITPPTPKQVRTAVLVWIASALAIVDALFLLMQYAF